MKYAIWSCYALTDERKAARKALTNATSDGFSITVKGVEGWESRHYKDGMSMKDMPVVCHDDINEAYRWINNEERIRPQQKSIVQDLPLFFMVKEYDG